MDVYYFGCRDQPGHFLFDARGRRVWEGDLPRDFPVRVSILDGGLLPPFQPEEEGRLSIWRTRGWAILAFWDRSVDTRGKCNSAIVMRCQTHRSDAELVQAAVTLFRPIFERFNFPLVRPDGTEHQIRSRQDRAPLELPEPAPRCITLHHISPDR